MARVMEQKINLQASRGHSPTSDPSSQLQKGILAGGPGGKLAGARAVGMDEGMGSRSDLATRDTALNLGHAQAPRPAGGATGRRILEEEKNQYISNPFWASMSEVCMMHLDPLAIAKLYDRSKKGYKNYLKTVMTSPTKIRLSCRTMFLQSLITTAS